MLQGLTSSLTPFAAGYLCHSQCGDLPCSAQFGSSEGSFKLSILVHSSNLHGHSVPGALTNARPYVCVSVGDKAKETEQGDWSKEQSAWSFGETVTFEVTPRDVLLISVNCAMRYELIVATISTRSSCLGVLSLPVASVLHRLRWEDRDTEGMIYATPLLSFDIVQDGRLNGELHISFETKSFQPLPPQQLPGDNDETCCDPCHCGAELPKMPRLAAQKVDDEGAAGDKFLFGPRAWKADQSVSRRKSRELPKDWWKQGHHHGQDVHDGALHLPPWAQGISAARLSKTRGQRPGQCTVGSICDAQPAPSASSFATESSLPENDADWRRTAMENGAMRYSRLSHGSEPRPAA